MITGFKHRALKRFFETGSARGLSAEQVPKIRLILARLSASVTPRDMNLPGLYLHELTGKRKGTWSVRVSENWRITFRFDAPDAYEIDLEDYH
jgi:proteic killer suppression protein